MERMCVRREKKIMKVCKMGLNSIWVDHANGELRLCAWADYHLGNLVDNTIEELWHGEKAEAFRQSMLDGSYKFCDCQACPYLANNTLDELMVEYDVPEYPKYCSMSYEEQCNYVCVFCRKEHYIPQKDENRKIEKVEREISKFFGQLDTVSANGVGELFCSNHTLNLLSTLDTDKNMEVILESNGSLFNRKNWERISNLGKYNLKVYITLHSFEENTYQFLSGTNMSVATVIENLHFIQELRDKNIINYFEIATVICERNFREMPSFVEKCLTEFNPDKIRLRYFIPYNVDDKSVEWFYDIRNPYHPYYKEFVKVMQDPIFNNSKVWKWQGENVSELGEHPYKLEHKKNKLMGQIIGIDNFEEKLNCYFEMHNIKSFSLYGFSNICKYFVNLVYMGKLVLDKIYDSNCKEVIKYKNTCVVSPEDTVLNSDAIIITSVFYDEIHKKLMELNYGGHIIYIEDLLNKLEKSI